MKRKAAWKVFCYAISFCTLFTACTSNSSEKNAEAEVIKAYCIDFNWGPGGKHGFAAPGLWADADPEEHVQWYKDLGCNTIQTLAVSCNGYAWYKNGGVPEQPGLEHDFLPEMVRLGHENGMKVLGYFCAGANNRWEELYPEEVYHKDARQIPYTTKYLDYLAAAIEEAFRKTDMDGFMIDWFYNPGGCANPLPSVRWLPCEQEMYGELMGEAFPGKDKMTPEIELDFRRKAIDRAWERIRGTAKRVKPDCIIWLSSAELRSLEYQGTRVVSEADWVMNERGDISRTESVREIIGEHARLMTCLADWNDQDPVEIVRHASESGIGLYGFTKPVVGNMMKPVDYYLGNPIDSLENDEKNLAVFARTYNGHPLDYVKGTVK